MRLFNGFLVMLLAFLVPGNLAQAAFHFMQIEQVIGGVNGDTTAQAVQLRMRIAGQNVMSMSRLVVVDATGSNPIVLKDMTSNVANSAAGSRVLLTTSNFASYTDIPLVTDFVMDPIPASYLAAGQLRFMDDFSTIYWSLSWGGAGYTGSTTGSMTNDSNGIFGPPVNIALPSTTLQALRFTGTAAQLSTNNLAQYALTTGAAVFTNNANTSFTVVAPGDFNGDGEVNAADYVAWRKNDDSQARYDTWRAHFGETTGIGAGSAGVSPSHAAVPEPATLVLLFTSALLATRRRRL